MGVTQQQEIKARPNQIRALDAFRRARRVTLDALAQRFAEGTRSVSWLSRALAGYVPLTQTQVRELRQIIEQLAAEGNR